MKKLFLVAAMSILMIACNDKEKISEDGQVQGEKKVVKVWAWDKNFNVSIMNRAAEKYEKIHPNIDIQVVDYGREDIETKLHTNFMSGVSKGLPEIVLIEDYSAKKFLTSYPGNFTPLEKNIDYSNFAKYKIDLMKEGNHIYGVPFDSGVTGMFYRSDILNKAGFTHKDLENITWDRFIEIGKVVKEKTGINMLAGDLTGDAGIIKIMMQSAGSWYFKKDGSLNIINNKALAQALELQKKIKDSGIMLPTVGWGEWVGAINNEKAASTVTGVWIMGSVKQGDNQSGKWSIASTPRLSVEGSKNASNLGGSSWYVVDNTPNKEIAIDFLKTMYAGDNEFYSEILKNNGAIGTYLPAQKGEVFTQEDKFFNNEKVYEKFAQWIPEIPSVNYGAYMGEADNAVLNQLRPFIDGKITTEEALKNIDNEIKSRIQ